jgi:hypothetical protein
VAWPADRLRLPAGAVAGVLVASLLAGCASQQAEYCSTLRDDKAQLTKLSSAKGDVLARGLTVFTELRDQAPPDVEEDWTRFVGAWQGLVEALHAAGVDPRHFDPAHRPAGVTTGQLQSIEQAARKLRSEDVRLAAARIEDHARVVCHVDLGGGLPG